MLRNVWSSGTKMEKSRDVARNDQCICLHLLLVLLLVVLVRCSVDLASLVSGNLLLDTGTALLAVELGGVALLGLGLELGALLGGSGGFERGVLADGSVGARVELFNVLGTNLVGEVARELLLEAARQY